MRKILKVLVIVAVAAQLGGCVSTFSANLAKFNAWVNAYAPVIGKDLIMIANILVQAECSPILAPATGAVQNTLKITAPNSSGASKVSAVLAENALIAAQLCPLVQAVRTVVGPVPQGAPSQIIATPAVSS